MTFHHIIREGDQQNVCPYCRRNVHLKRWENRFDRNSLYKEMKCACGKTVSIKMPFSGSGDDSWGKDDLDKRVEEVDSESQTGKND